MAEKVTVAEITIDEAGAVRALSNTQNALRQTATNVESLGARTSSAADVFEHRMFSMRHAAIALLGGFTLAGLIQDLKGLASQVVKSAESFGELEAAGATLNREFNAMAVETFNVNAGIQGTVTWMDRLSGVMRAVTVAQTSHPAAAAAVKDGFISAVLFGIPGASGIMRGIHDVGAAIDSLFAKQIAAATAGQNFIGPPAPPGYGNFDYHPPAEKKPVPFGESPLTGWKAYTDTADALKGVVVNLQAAIPLAEDFNDTLKDAPVALSDVVLWLRQAGGAYQQLGEAAGFAFGALLAGQNIDLSGFIRAVLTSIAQQASVKAIFEIAEGLAASARYAASYFTDVAQGAAAKLHYTAAAKYFGVAAAAGVGARAFGGGGGGGGGSGGGGIARAAPPERQGQIINNYFEGSLIGVGRTMDQFADAMLPAMQRSLARGTVGGSL